MYHIRYHRSPDVFLIKWCQRVCTLKYIHPLAAQIIHCVRGISVLFISDVILFTFYFFFFTSFHDIFYNLKICVLERFEKKGEQKLKKIKESVRESMRRWRKLTLDCNLVFILVTWKHFFERKAGRERERDRLFPARYWLLNITSALSFYDKDTTFGKVNMLFRDQCTALPLVSVPAHTGVEVAQEHKFMTSFKSL